ncbi:unnamed protein product [Adineta steineri]|uniref:Peptidase S1 domain-containing protein n=1 Tax=Adineta steineri TaxID=433720 RepID=A0A814H1Y6_9BILA|nr:unnamed protein product [Adineta steineri]CAF1295224.1 unnamed protein product [Adineta steineri]CAF1571805.1 unnamed protein product [Adineta steineri]CAF1572562.1 unnamed protein product [Adineta steineri]
MISYGYKRKHICVGTFTTSEYVLTAAHCLYSIGISNIEIRICITNSNDISYENLFSIQKVILHKDCNPNTYKNDIVLIRLDRSIIQMLYLPHFTYIYIY